MNKLLSCVLQTSVLAASLASGAQLFAQETGAPPETSAPPPTPGPGGGHRGMMGDPDQQLARMTARYNLSADQQTKIKPILASTQQQMQALHGDSSLSRDDRMAKMQSIRSDSKTRIESVLNDDQKKQFEQDQKEMMERMQQRGQGGPGGGGPPPPPQ
jgi:Spy/CpxP family protein refolding chaperone